MNQLLMLLLKPKVPLHHHHPSRSQRRSSVRLHGQTGSSWRAWRRLLNWALALLPALAHALYWLSSTTAISTSPTVRLTPAHYCSELDQVRLTPCVFIFLIVLIVAGDSRAVLGKLQDPTEDSGTLLAVPLSRDQNAMVKFEQEKLVREHPGEPNAFVCREPDSCYVKGALQPTRAFGDFSLKFSEFNGPPYDKGDRSAGHHTPAPFSPPYITAIPELKSVKLHDGGENNSDRFLILGSDGVWDFLSNEQAVECVREQVVLGDFENAGHALVEKTLQQAAKKHGISYEELLELAPGTPRRPVHDDTTVIVLFF